MKVLMFLWQLPQNILAWLLILLYKQWIYEMVYNDTKKCMFIIMNKKYPFNSFSLGDHIFLESGIAWFLIGEQNVSHEYGHTLQSRKYGPLYLFIVGLPSLFNNLRSRIDKKFVKDYYKTWPENEADKLGKVIR